MRNRNVLKRGRINSERSLSEAGKHRLWLQLELYSPRSWGQDGRLVWLASAQATIRGGVLAFRD